MKLDKNNPNFWALIGFGVGAVVASAGSFSNPIDSALGGLFQAALWYGVARLILRKRNSQISSTDAPTGQTRKFCKKCKLEVPEDRGWCANCGCVVFSVVIQETKKCPMCSEEIKIFAKKCRFCQEILDN
jgi:hypothetical protein